MVNYALPKVQEAHPVRAFELRWIVGERERERGYAMKSGRERERERERGYDAR